MEREVCAIMAGLHFMLLRFGEQVRHYRLFYTQNSYFVGECKSSIYVTFVDLL